jgi:hypothetical protein
MSFLPVIERAGRPLPGFTPAARCALCGRV